MSEPSHNCFSRSTLYFLSKKRLIRMFFSWKSSVCKRIMQELGQVDMDHTERQVCCHILLLYCSLILNIILTYRKAALNNRKLTINFSYYKNLSLYSLRLFVWVRIASTVNWIAQREQKQTKACSILIILLHSMKYNYCKSFKIYRRDKSLKYPFTITKTMHSKMFFGTFIIDII